MYGKKIEFLLLGLLSASSNTAVGTNCQNCQPTITPTTNTTTETATVVHRCILLLGGNYLDSATPLMEYYHPTKGECDRSVGRVRTSGLLRTRHTAGCYLSDTEQILIREVDLREAFSPYPPYHPNKPPMVYGLRDFSAKHLPLPYKYSGSPIYTWGSTAAAIGPSKCLSCGGSLNECYQFDSASPTNWTSMPPLPNPLAHLASVSMANNNSYYVMGGRGQTWEKQLFRYSIDERRWYEETPMAEGRIEHSAAALSATEFIVCGGRNHRNDCEVYNTTERKWRRVGNLTTGRENFALVNFEGRVYALGGEGYGLFHIEKLYSVEVYNVRTEKWTELNNRLKHGRYAFVAVVV